MHRLTATDTPMVCYTRTIFPSYAPDHLPFPENPDLTKNQSTKNVPDNHPVHYVSQYEPHLTNNSEVLMLLPD